MNIRRGPKKGIGLLAVAFGFATGYSNSAIADPAAQQVTNLTVTSVGDTDYGGEVIVITVSPPVVAGCTYTNAYAIRDANIIKGGLALLIAARLSGNPVSLYVTGACDTSGFPLVASVSLN